MEKRGKQQPLILVNGRNICSKTPTDLSKLLDYCKFTQSFNLVYWSGLERYIILKMYGILWSAIVVGSRK